MEIGSYEAAQREKARALRAKFYSPKPTVNKIVIKRQEERPEWRKIDCWFHEHVLAYRKQKAFEESIRSFCVTHQINLDGIGVTSYRRPLEEICKEVLLGYPGVTLSDVRGVRRTRKVVAARHSCIKAVYDEREDLSSPVIGKYFLRDHTVVLYAAGKLSARKSKANERLARAPV